MDDSNGVEDDNLVEHSNSPTGPLSVGTWSDDAGDSGTAQLQTNPPWRQPGTPRVGLLTPQGKRPFEKLHSWV